MSDYLTYSPVKKPSRRDAKVGAKFVLTAGYGPHVLYEAEIHGRDSRGIVYTITWTSTPYEPVGKQGFISLAEVSDLISRGLMRFQDFDRETRLLTARPMTADERVQADERAASWHRFTQSETYQCM
jgi:hypothetical protein